MSLYSIKHLHRDAPLFYNKSIYMCHSRCTSKKGKKHSVADGLARSKTIQIHAPQQPEFTRTTTLSIAKIRLKFPAFANSAHTIQWSIKSIALFRNLITFHIVWYWENCLWCLDSPASRWSNLCFQKLLQGFCQDIPNHWQVFTALDLTISYHNPVQKQKLGAMSHSGWRLLL